MQEECFRLVLARGADPDFQDTNGNTVLHMLVIYEKMEMFDVGYEVGSNIHVRNIQNLTPLTLAAKLGRVEMFFHVMSIEREIYWQLGSITCAAYPLLMIDTINEETGNINKDSVLNFVVFGDKLEHLELLDGVVIDLLKTKWDTFCKSRFYKQFYMFAFYFLISLFSFILRPGPAPKEDEDEDQEGNSATASNGTATHDLYSNRSFTQLTKRGTSSTEYSGFCISSRSELEILICCPTETFWLNFTEYYDPNEVETLPAWWQTYAQCPLMNLESDLAKLRIIAELINFVGAILYLVVALREARFLGYKMFIENLVG